MSFRHTPWADLPLRDGKGKIVALKARVSVERDWNKVSSLVQLAL